MEIRKLKNVKKVRVDEDANYFLSLFDLMRLYGPQTVNVFDPKFFAIAHSERNFKAVDVYILPLLTGLYTKAEDVSLHLNRFGLCMASLQTAILLNDQHPDLASTHPNFVQQEDVDGFFCHAAWDYHKARRVGVRRVKSVWDLGWYTLAVQA